MSVALMRANATKMIADNSVSITISRKTRTKTGGKLSSSTTTIAAQTVRIYGKNTAEIARSGDESRFVRIREVRMLAAYNANVLPDTNLNEDTFTSGSNTYRIKNVRDITWLGSIVSKECTLEEVK